MVDNNFNLSIEEIGKRIDQFNFKNKADKKFEKNLFKQLKNEEFLKQNDRKIMLTHAEKLVDKRFKRHVEPHPIICLLRDFARNFFGWKNKLEKEEEILDEIKEKTYRPIAGEAFRLFSQFRQEEALSVSHFNPFGVSGLTIL